MKKKRTKEEKRLARARRRERLEQSPIIEKDSHIRTTTSHVPNPYQNVKLLGYDLRLIRNDLLKTIVATIVISLILGVIWYYL